MKFTVDMLTRGVDFERFKKAYWSDAFNSVVVAEANLIECTVCEHVTLPDGKLRRRIRVVPRMELPTTLLKFLEGHTIRYEEVMLLDPVARKARLDVHTIAGDLLQVGADADFIEQPQGLLMRLQTEANVKLFGVSGMIERHLANEVRSRYVLVGQALQRFVDAGRDLEAAAAAGR